jgi:hypothetical protein
MTIIRGQRLTTFDLAPDGETVAINVEDDEATPGALSLPTECLNELIMTLPEMMKRALQLRYGDRAMRLVYPVGEWNVEGSGAPGTLTVTLGTPDGFEVSFAIPALTVLRMATAGARAAPRPVA